MKVLLVYPDVMFKDSNWPGYYYQGIGYLAAVLKGGGHTVSLLHVTRPLAHDAFEAELQGRGEPGVVAFTVTTNMWPYVSEWARWVREAWPGVLILCGGVHAILNPERVLTESSIDAVCVGEGEPAVFELCARLEAGGNPLGVDNIWYRHGDKVHRTKVRPPLADLDQLPFPDRDVFDYPRLYHEAQGEASVMASRGCPFKCSYCCNEALWRAYGKSKDYVRFRSVDHVMRELRQIRERYPFVQKFSFDDDILPLRKDWFEAFAHAYKAQVAVPFTCNMRVDLVDEKIADLLAHAGCWRVHMGIESGDEALRKRVLNRKITDEQVRRAFALFRERGIKLYSYNMVGIPGEGMAEMLETVKLNAELAPDVSQVSIFYPYKGTLLYEHCHEQGLIAENEITDYFEGSKLKQTQTQKAQLLFVSRYFVPMMALYRRLGGRGRLARFMTKFVDYVLSRRLPFRLIRFAVVRTWPALRNAMGCGPHKRADGHPR